MEVCPPSGTASTCWTQDPRLASAQAARSPRACSLPRSELGTRLCRDGGDSAGWDTALPKHPFLLLWRLQLMPLLKLRHDHIAFYRELFITWNGKVGPSPPLRARRRSAAAGTGDRAQSTPTCHRKPSCGSGGSLGVVPCEPRLGLSGGGADRLRETGASPELTTHGCVAHAEGGPQAWPQCPEHSAPELVLHQRLSVSGPLGGGVTSLAGADIGELAPGFPRSSGTRCPGPLHPRLLRLPQSLPTSCLFILRPQDIRRVGSTVLSSWGLRVAKELAKATQLVMAERVPIRASQPPSPVLHPMGCTTSCLHKDPEAFKLLHEDGGVERRGLAAKGARVSDPNRTSTLVPAGGWQPRV